MRRYGYLDEDTDDFYVEENNAMNNMFNGLFGKLGAGMCRISMNGDIAVKTSNGYKSYNIKDKRLVNCTNFVLNISDDFFFVVPTNNVAVGDIILDKNSGKPKCVIQVNDNIIKVIDYENSVVQDIIPERHVFMGNTYFYGKIVSMFGSDITKGKMNTKKIMSYMLMTQMFRGNNSEFGEGMSNILPMMMLFNKGNNDMFGGIFDNIFDLEDNNTNNSIEPTESTGPVEQ